jgi:hypothetical protein
VYAIEPHEHFRGVLGGLFTPRNRVSFFENLLRSNVTEIVRLISVSSEVVAPGWREPIGLIFIDGDHRLEAVWRDFECWTAHVVQGGLMVFHDSIDPNLGPFRVVEGALSSGDYARVGIVSRATVLHRIRPAKSGGTAAR